MTAPGPATLRCDNLRHHVRLVAAVCRTFSATRMTYRVGPEVKVTVAPDEPVRVTVATPDEPEAGR